MKILCFLFASSADVRRLIFGGAWVLGEGGVFVHRGVRGYYFGLEIFNLPFYTPRVEL